MPRSVLLAALILLPACETPVYDVAIALPGSRIESMQSFYVVHRGGDRRNIERDIAAQLEALGFEATTGAAEPTDPGAYDAVVTYVDRHRWDVTTYCTQLTLYIRDTRTGFITATGSSWRPSLMRRTPGEHAEILLTELLGVAP